MYPLSHSKLKQFMNCPALFKAMYIDKSVPKVSTQAIVWGKTVHSAIELFISEGRDSPYIDKETKQFIVELLALTDVAVCEMPFGLDVDYALVSFDSRDAYIRGIVDFVGVFESEDGLCGVVCDWKTGNSAYPDFDQLDLYSLVLMIALPDINYVQAFDFFSRSGEVKAKTVYRHELSQLKTHIEANVAALLQAFGADVFPYRSSPLCAYCALVHTCEGGTKYRYRARQLGGNK